MSREIKNDEKNTGISRNKPRIKLFSVYWCPRLIIIHLTMKYYYSLQYDGIAWHLQVKFVFHTTHNTTYLRIIDTRVCVSTYIVTKASKVFFSVSWTIICEQAASYRSVSQLKEVTFR